MFVVNIFILIKNSRGTETVFQSFQISGLRERTVLELVHTNRNEYEKSENRSNFLEREGLMWFSA